jgi:hypothetical protein
MTSLGNVPGDFFLHLSHSKIVKHLRETIPAPVIRVLYPLYSPSWIYHRGPGNLLLCGTLGPHRPLLKIAVSPTLINARHLFSLSPSQRGSRVLWRNPLLEEGTELELNSLTTLQGDDPISPSCLPDYKPSNGTVPTF